MYQGYGQGYSGMFGAAQGASSGLGESKVAPANSTQSVSDLFAQLQKQIPGFENIPTPRAFTEQSKARQETKQPFKGVSRSNLFVQCINRDGVEHGLKTDEQAQVPSMNIFGMNRVERSYKDFNVDLFSGLDKRSTEIEVNRGNEQGKIPNIVDYSHGKERSTPIGTKNPALAHGAKTPQKAQGAKLSPNAQRIKTSTTVQAAKGPTTAEGANIRTLASGGSRQVPPVVSGSKNPVSTANPAPAQWQMSLMEYGSSDDHEQQEHHQQIHDYDQTVQQEHHQQIHGYDQTVQQEHHQQIHGYDQTVQQEHQQQIHGYDQTVRQEHQQQIHGYDQTVRQEHQQQIHGYNQTVPQNRQQAYVYCPHQSPYYGYHLQPQIYPTTDQHKEENREGRSYSTVGNYSNCKRDDNVGRDEKNRKYERRNIESELKHSPERCLLSPERRRRSPETLRRSPDRHKRSSETWRSPERRRRSPEKLRRSPERQRQSSSKLDDSRKFQHDRSPIRDNSKWFRDDTSERDQRNNRWASESSKPNAKLDDSRKLQHDRSPIQDNIKWSRDDKSERDQRNNRWASESSKPNAKLDDSRKLQHDRSPIQDNIKWSRDDKSERDQRNNRWASESSKPNATLDDSRRLQHDRSPIQDNNKWFRDDRSPQRDQRNNRWASESSKPNANLDDSRKSRRDRSPIQDNIKWSRDDKSEGDQRNDRRASESSKPSAKLDDSRKSRRDRSPIQDNIKWSRDDKSERDQSNNRWASESSKPNAKLDDSRKSRRDRSPIRDNSKRSRNDKSERDQRNNRWASESSKTNSELHSDVFKRPHGPPLGSKTSSSRTSVNEDFNFSEMPPPKVYDSKKRNRGENKRDESKPKQIKEGPESDDDDDGDEDSEDFVSLGFRPLIKKEPPKQHQILLKKTQNFNKEKMSNLSQHGTASVQSRYDSEQVRISTTSSSEKSPKEVQGNLADPRKPFLGEEISDFIANFIRTVGKSKRGVQIVAKKYHLPGNCIGLNPPKMSHDVWDILKKPTQMRDETLQDVQRWLSVGIIPVIEQIDLFGAGTQEAKNVCRVTSDSLTVLGYVLLNMSIKRRLLMRNSLNKKYASLCRTSNKVTDLLFGDSLAKDLIEVKFGTYQVEKSREEDNDDMLSPNYKPTFFSGLAVPGADVDANVASMINMACANEGDVEDLKEKYKIPPNCETLIPAKINPEMWSLLSRSGLELDYRLQDVQLSIAEGTVPLMRLLQSVHEKSYDPCEALGMLTDALALLGNAVYQMNKLRMEAMLKTLPEAVHNFGHWYWPGAEQVSGENLQEELQVCEDDNSNRRAGLILGVMQSQTTQFS